jgi:hypothetical protein
MQIYTEIQRAKYLGGECAPCILVLCECHDECILAFVPEMLICCDIQMVNPIGEGLSKEKRDGDL